MNPVRKNRLYMAVFILIAVAGGVTALMLAMEENLNMFYPPDKIVSGDAPQGKTIRAGGMVVDGSVRRAPDSLAVEFTLTDHQGSEFIVDYTGILPDLFREGQGILVRGELSQVGRFSAVEVLAKHDENYMPPELLDLAKEGGSSG
ncbi:MAG: cytochrome c maturation protein CcmE [Pseudomonadales bacterium]|nr:cytochrome c maturation protein CcmE [Pseudomonadales bacterium]